MKLNEIWLFGFIIDKYMYILFDILLIINSIYFIEVYNF